MFKIEGGQGGLSKSSAPLPDRCVKTASGMAMGHERRRWLNKKLGRNAQAHKRVREKLRLHQQVSEVSQVQRAFWLANINGLENRI
jgi:hypothetical protein